MSEQKNDELLDTTEKEQIKEKKEEKNPSQFTPLSRCLMIIIVLCILGAGCWYTYYQYKRMEEINNAKSQ